MKKIMYMYIYYLCKKFDVIIEESYRECRFIELFVFLVVFCFNKFYKY